MLWNFDDLLNEISIYLLFFKPAGFTNRREFTKAPMFSRRASSEKFACIILQNKLSFNYKINSSIFHKKYAMINFFTGNDKKNRLHINKWTHILEICDLSTLTLIMTSKQSEIVPPVITYQKWNDSSLSLLILVFCCSCHLVFIVLLWLYNNLLYSLLNDINKALSQTNLHSTKTKNFLSLKFSKKKESVNYLSLVRCIPFQCLHVQSLFCPFWNRHGHILPLWLLQRHCLSLNLTID